LTQKTEARFGFLYFWGKIGYMKKYTMQIVKGALVDPEALSKFNPKVSETFDDSEWGCLLEVELSLEEIKEVQKNLTKHYEGPIPWYMDGKLVDDENEIIVAFGADDGFGGKIFIFDKHDKENYQKMLKHGIIVGIPEEQINFINK